MAVGVAHSEKTPQLNAAKATEWLSSIYGSLKGVTAPSIARVEKKLGRPLPSALRTLYLKTGASRALHQAHNRLISPAQLKVVGSHLVFYEENQEVVMWGIHVDHLGEVDPKVEQGQPHDDGHIEWHSEFKSVSEFMCAQGAWQAVQGGLPWVGSLADGSEQLDALLRSLGAQSLDTEGLRAWSVPGGIFVHAGKAYLGLATHTRSDFERASAQLGINGWDFATAADED